MSPAAPLLPEAAKRALDKFVSTAYTNPNLMKFIEVAVASFDSKKTIVIRLDVKDGEAKGGEGSFKF